MPNTEGQNPQFYSEEFPFESYVAQDQAAQIAAQAQAQAEAAQRAAQAQAAQLAAQAQAAQAQAQAQAAQSAQAQAAQSAQAQANYGVHAQTQLIPQVQTEARTVQAIPQVQAAPQMQAPAQVQSKPQEPHFVPNVIQETPYSLQTVSEPYEDEYLEEPVSTPMNAAPTVRPVSLGGPAPVVGTPTGIPVEEDLEALSAYKALESRNKRRRRKRILAGVLVGALALAGIAWFATQNLMQPTPDANPVIDYGVVTRETFEKSVNASGAIKPASQVVVSPEIEGTITEVNVAEGDTVLKGDVLFTLKNDSLEKTIKEAEQALKSARNGVTSAETTVNTTYAAYSAAVDKFNQVYATLYESQEEADAAGAEATEALNTAQSTYNEAQLALENAQLAVTTAQEALDKANDDAEKRTVRAPESGVIIAMRAGIGVSVGSSSGGSSDPLMTIADLTELRVSVQVNEVDINELQEGQEAEVTFSALPDVVLTATVEHIAKVSSGSGSEESFGGGGIVTYNVELLIANPDPEVKPGMTARVKILTNKIEDALVVPTAALQMTGENEATVFVATDMSSETPQFEQRIVKVIAQDSTMAAVEGRLQEGEEVQLFFDEYSNDSMTEVG